MNTSDSNLTQWPYFLLTRIARTHRVSGLSFLPTEGPVSCPRKKRCVVHPHPLPGEKLSDQGVACSYRPPPPAPRKSDETLYSRYHDAHFRLDLYGRLFIFFTAQFICVEYWE